MFANRISGKMQWIMLPDAELFFFRTACIQSGSNFSPFCETASEAQDNPS